MTVRRPTMLVVTLSALVAFVVGAAGCSSDAAVSDDTLPAVATTSTIAATPTVATSTPTGPTQPGSAATTIPSGGPTAPSTSTTSTTSTSSTTSTTSTTTTTVPQIGVQLVLRDNGIGDALFGAHPDDVIPYINGILGDPTTDSGWADPMSFGVCPGTEVRLVSWNDLSLLFTDSSVVTSGRRRFFTYTYGPAFATGRIDPNGPRTELGIGVGSSVAELKAAYPSVIVNAADDIFDANFYIDETLTGFLTGDGDSDTIRSFTGGISCGD